MCQVGEYFISYFSIPLEVLPNDYVLTHVTAADVLAVIKVYHIYHICHTVKKISVGRRDNKKIHNDMFSIFALLTMCVIFAY